ncbi:MULTISPECIES: hypothetical protein [unclassified Mesorhizobium]|uniref:hypothetical protein n=1 Tax=unclassified Mesorhizobium TaxID=325217 RepID=UPI00301485A2
MNTQEMARLKLLDAIDELDVTSGLCRALDMALENDDSENSEALRQLLIVISNKVAKARGYVDEARESVLP